MSYPGLDRELKINTCNKMDRKDEVKDSVVLNRGIAVEELNRLYVLYANGRDSDRSRCGCERAMCGVFLLAS